MKDISEVPTLEINEAEKQRTRRALRIVNEQRRVEVTGMDLLKFFGKVLLGALVLYGFAFVRGIL